MELRRILRNGTASVIVAVALGGLVVGCGQVDDQVRPTTPASQTDRRTPTNAETIEQRDAALTAAAAQRRAEAARARINEMRVRIMEMKDRHGTR